MILKIINYNILHGFHTSSKPFELEKERLENVKKLISSENPDILILTEACYGEENKYDILMDYQEIFKFPYYFYGGRNIEWGSAILSKYPIIKSENLSEWWVSILRTQIKIKNKFLNVDVVHPYPNIDEDGRLKLFKKILKKYELPYILTGDFNAISPEDSYDRTKLVKGFKTFTKDAEKIVDSLLGKKAISYILSKGLKDAFKVKNKSFEFTVPTDFLSKNKDSGVRIDYIFCSMDMRIIDSKIIKNKITETASDHYPVLAVIDI